MKFKECFVKNNAYTGRNSSKEIKKDLAIMTARCTYLESQQDFNSQEVFLNNLRDVCP